MKQISDVGLQDVQNVYGGAEGKLWELIMGQQIHIGGMKSSMDLAQKADIRPGSSGIDLCCCSGAGMRFLLRFRGVERMQGVDATLAVVESGRQRNREEGFDGRISFVQADVCSVPLADGCGDFVWGEDAWCYVTDKARLISEATRLVPVGGVVAFTDWIEGKDLPDSQAQRFMRFMKFPSILNQADYVKLLQSNGCEIVHAHDTGRFAPYIDLYLKMLDMQLTSDALRIIGYDMNLMAALAGEMAFVKQLADAGQIAQGLFVARKVR